MGAITAATMTEPQGTLFPGIARLYNNDQYSDLRLIHRGATYYLHRAVVCTQSKWFAAIVKPGFKEYETGVITLDEDDEPEEVRHMIEYLYRQDYGQKPSTRRSSRTWQNQSHAASPTARPAFIVDPLVELANSMDHASSTNEHSPQPNASKPLPTQSSDTPRSDEREVRDCYPANQQPVIESDTDLLTHVYAYAHAEKYFIQGMKDCAQRKFRDHLKQQIDDPVLPEALELAYETTVESDRGLRNIVISTFRSNPALQTRRDIRAAIQNTPQLKQELQNVRLGYPATHRGSVRSTRS